MKTAWGWLAAGVVALGLNGFYQDGGAQWLHQRVGLIGHRTEVVLALATGHVDRFLAEARLVTAQQRNVRCPLAIVAQTAEPAEVAVPRTITDSNWLDLQSRSDRELARGEREQALERAQLDRQLAQVNAVTARLQAKLDRSRVAAVFIDPVVVHVPAVRISAI